MTRILSTMIQALLISKSARALSTQAGSFATSAATKQPGRWSAMAIQTAHELTISARQKLYDDGVMDLKYERPVQIKGEPISQEQQQQQQPTNGEGLANTNTKILHFQRHGQGFHNVLCAQWRELTGSPVNLESDDPSQNPMLREAVVDAPLTEVGRQECLSCQEEATLLNPELVIVSPLLRAIQSAELTWSAHRPFNNPQVPWLAHEDCREELGLLMCNKRRPISETQTTYPEIDFSFCHDDEDTLFIPDRGETALEKTQRVYDFLLFVCDLPQTEIAVIGHSAWLFNMCNAVMDIEDEASKSWFLTSEIRSLQVTFAD